MNPNAQIVIMRYEDRFWPNGHRANVEIEPPEAPSDFWINAMHYMKMCAVSGPGGMLDRNFEKSHLFVHAEETLEEMIDKYPEEWIFWLIEETGSWPTAEAIKAYIKLRQAGLTTHLQDDWLMFEKGTPREEIDKYFRDELYCSIMDAREAYLKYREMK